MNGRAAGAKSVALLFVLALLVAAACGGSGHPAASPAATVPATETSGATASPPAHLGAPGRDLMDLARRYRGVPADAPRVARDKPFSYKVGDSETFTVVNLDVPEITHITATVRAITAHAYFFVQNGTSYSDSNLQQDGAGFETKVYPLITGAFGHEWIPGVDDDPRMTILHANLQGAGGYVSSNDEYPRAAALDSNEREMLYVDSSAIDSPGVQYDALVAHEFQHLIHAYSHQNEDAWVNEGLSQVAAEMAGGGSNWVNTFTSNPDTQLNYWPPQGDTTIHYAASELFFAYLLDHYGGRNNASKLLQIPDEGIAGVDEYLKPFGKTFEDVFADWIAANYVDADTGIYSHGGTHAKVAVQTSIIQDGQGQGSVSQFGAEYMNVNPPGGRGTFTFEGSRSVSIGIPSPGGAASPGSGQDFWWAGRGDGIDSRLTREFDLTGLTSATLRFSVWTEIERGWDFAYVSVSTDGGGTWRALAGRHTSDYNPVLAAYGRGYTGDSGGWQGEQIDLTPYAGKKVLLRFEYVTDDSTNLTGFAVANIEIPELGFSDHADSDNGWQVEGFERISGPMAQQFVVEEIQGDQVTRVPLDAANKATVTLDGNATIVVSAVTDNTTEKATYNWTLSAP